MKKNIKTNKILPSTYKELYFDTIKQNWRSLIGYGLTLFLFAIPILTVLILKEFYISSLAASSYTEEEKLAFLGMSNIFFSLGISVFLLFICVGISGLSRVLLLLSREEPVFFFHDFAKGVKQNLKNNIVLFIIYAVLFFLTNLITIIVKTPVSYIPLGIVQCLIFPLVLINIETTCIYSWNIKDSIFNAAIIYVKNFLIILLFSLIYSSVLLIIGIPNVLAKYVTLFVLIIVATPFIALAMRVYMNYCLDRDINSEYYPEIYKKGIFVPEISKTMSHTFTNDSTYKELVEDSFIGKYSAHLLSYIKDIDKIFNNRIIDNGVDAWPKEDIVKSLNLLKHLTMKGLTKLISRSGYSAIICKQEKRSKVAIVMAGGGYAEVCTLPEELPVSMELYKKGFSVISFSYSVKKNAKQALSELKDLINYLSSNTGLYNIDMDDYLLVGFSAGAHLCGELATNNLGYESANLKKPGLLVLCYPVIDVSLCHGTRTNLLGENPTDEEIKEYSINEHIYEKSPSIFFWQNNHDNVVPYENSLKLLEALKKNKISFEFENFDSDVHGWGIATNTLADGWIERMYNFYLSLINK